MKSLPQSLVLILNAASFLGLPSRAAAVDTSFSTPLHYTCQDLAVVTYWAGTAHLSRADRQELRQARTEALQGNNLRPAIAPGLVRDAEFVGRTAHGNHGSGNTSLHDARGNAILAALYVQQDCFETSGSKAGR